MLGSRVASFYKSAGAAVTMGRATAGGVATSVAAGQHLDVPVVASAVGVGLKAIGGYVGVRKILDSKSAPEEAR